MSNEGREKNVNLHPKPLQQSKNKLKQLPLPPSIVKVIYKIYK
jgi:hypothetical protein